MAITILDFPQGIYPAYNDSILKFTSDLSDNYLAKITIQPTSKFPKPFDIYSFNGVYEFNLKEVVKSQLNENHFEDINFFTDEYYKTIDGLYLSQDLSIVVFNQNGENEFIEQTYLFFKAVNQIAEPIHKNDYQLLTNTKDGVNHYLTYFEGFPFHFDIKRVLYSEDREIVIKNKATGIESQIIKPTKTSSNPLRINIDRSNGNNWTTENFLPIRIGLNHLEIYENGVFKSNLFLRKKKECKGVYLKWFNNQGGYSHYLFNHVFIEQTQANDLGRVLNSDSKNIEELTTYDYLIGKNVQSDFTITANYNLEEYEILKEILASPFVQMYTSQTANIEGKFIKIEVSGNIIYNSKRYTNQIILNVQFPKTITATL